MGSTDRFVALGLNLGGFFPFRWLDACLSLAVLAKELYRPYVSYIIYSELCSSNFSFDGLSFNLLEGLNAEKP